MNYTYRDLLEALQELSSDELDLHVTIYDTQREVYHPLNYTGKCEGDDVLDADHPIMIINDPDENVSEPEPHSEYVREAVDGEPTWIARKLIKGDNVSFYSDVLKKRIAGVVVKHWACDRYKIEISENNQPRYVYISEYNLRLL